MTMETIVQNFVVNEIFKNACSVIRGNKNYCVRIEKNSGGNFYAKVGRMGKMTREGYLSCYVYEMVEYNYKWFYFTYKKDLDNFLNMLKENNIQVCWIA